MTPAGHRLLWVLGCFLVPLIGALLADQVFPPDLSRAQTLSREIVDQEGQLLRVTLAEDDIWRMSTHIKDVPNHYLTLLTAFEDQRFYQHPGVDPLALVRAIGQAILSGRIISGASTLTMQTARLLEPRPRTLSSKLIEMARALQLEWRYSKSEILALYLTLAPFGGNIEGVRAASLAWFNKPAIRLTPAESALLVALPQAPERLRPDRHPEAARAARDKVIQRAEKLGRLPPKARLEWEDAVFRAKRHPMPNIIPHYSVRLLASVPTNKMRIDTPLKAEWQRQITQLLQRTASERDQHSSAAALVLDLHSREVVAYVGSPNAYDTTRLGAIDMIRAIRSPGSALKPFLYGAAFDAGWLHPLTRIGDHARQFGSYAPDNFNRTHQGDVTVQEALKASLNIPAVAVLNKLGPRRFVDHLADADVPLHFPQSPNHRPGLSVALGGVGVRLETLTSLYAALGSNQRFSPLRLTSSSPLDQADIPLFGTAAAWQVSNILRETPRPASLTATRHIAFKTGTSYGFRDAWAVGYGSRYAVGVWTGRADGTPIPGATGIKSAAPLLFNIFSMVEPTFKKLAPPPDSALLALRTKDLPKGLRQLNTTKVYSLKNNQFKELTISFPPDGAVLELSARNGSFQPVPLEALGGAKPLTWLANGQPIQAYEDENRSVWHPDGKGFSTITVQDILGNSKTATIRIE